MLLGAATLGGCVATGDQTEESMAGTVEYLNPEGLHGNPAYSQVVVTRGPGRTIYVGGQNAVDAAGTIVGQGDVAAQAAQIARNLQVALAAAEAGVEHVVKWTVYLVQDTPMEPAIGGFQQIIGELAQPPVISVMYVAGLAHPDFLLEIDAIAVVPGQE